MPYPARTAHSCSFPYPNRCRIERSKPTLDNAVLLHLSSTHATHTALTSLREAHHVKCVGKAWGATYARGAQKDSVR